MHVRLLPAISNK